ncbi:MAG TPA: 50S ribosomal protein L4 [Planctomycetaceae bacterium]|nr:50S ribosomal protein L4 [Planctomycetales bacterium]HAA62307.1 50S ribosomal protein L4 [Planctomycetaceae bacterium]|tara:strand:- start:1207 stop:1896 length:690 start_codon:yes stop_codon:yes gene_type:complete
MITLPVKDTNGDEVGSYKLDPDDFALHVNKQLLHDVVVMYEANQRQGASKTKSRGEVRGSTRKLYRQKGTGRARAGMRRSPVRRGGGHTFAKRPKDWSYRLPKKAIRTATRQALLSKFRDDEVTLLQDFVISEPRTRHVAAVLAALELTETSSLLAIPAHDSDIWRAARNIPNLWVSPAADLNAYKLLHQKQLVLTTETLDLLREGPPKAVPVGADDSDEASSGEEEAD